MQAYYYLVGFLFCLGLVGCLTKKNLVSILLCVELMLASVNLLFLLFSKVHGSLDAQIAVFFVVCVAAAEAAVGLSIIIVLFKKIHSTYTEDVVVQSE